MNILNHKIIKLVLLLLFMSTGIQPVLAEQSLDDYLKTAAENNPGLKAKFNEYLAALEKLPQAKSLPDPVGMMASR